MSKRYIILALTILFLGAGCARKNALAPAQLFDCGKDYDCFISAAQRCAPATMKETQTHEVLGVLQTTSAYREIKGFTQDRCTFYVKTEKVDAKYGEATIQDMIQNSFSREEVRVREIEINKTLDAMEGKDGTCKFKVDDLMSLLTRWKKGILSTDDYAAAECSGPIFENAESQEYTTLQGCLSRCEDDGGCQGWCFLDEATKTRESTLCEQIPDKTTNQNYYYQCINQLARLTKDAALCNRFPKGISGRDSCIFGVAAEARDVTLCARFPQGTSEHDSCLARVAEAMEDPALCERIADEFSRRSCKLFATPNGE